MKTFYRFSRLITWEKIEFNINQKKKFDYIQHPYISKSAQIF